MVKIEFGLCNKAGTRGIDLSSAIREEIEKVFAASLMALAMQPKCMGLKVKGV